MTDLPPIQTRRLVFRGIQVEADLPQLLEINLSSRQADGDQTQVTLEGLAQAFAPSDNFIPSRDVLIAFLADSPATAVGYTRTGWYSSRPDNRLYYQNTRLKQAFRGQGLWEEIIEGGEERIRRTALEHAPVAERWFQGWASNEQLEWTAALQNMGYKVVRRFNNMLLKLENPPQIPLPPGFEVRPVQPEHMHAIWQAQKEMNEGLFENVAEEWLEEKYPAWLENPEHTPQFWQVAWAGDQIAGIVLARYNAEEYENKSPKHGYTEHVFVRPA